MCNSEWQFICLTVITFPFIAVCIMNIHCWQRVMQNHLLMCAASSSWSRPMHMNSGGPTPRAAHVMCSFAQFLVIFGGRDTESRTNDLHIYDTGELQFYGTQDCRWQHNY